VETLRDNVVFLFFGLAVVDRVLLVFLSVQMRRLGKLRKAQLTVLGVHGERDIVAHTTHLAEQVRNMRDAVEALDERLDGHKAELDHAITLRAVERFDAFNDIGGEQSAAIALLDRHRSGVVVSSIHSRDYARLYVKELRDGVPDRALSPEEERVVAAAHATASAIATPATATTGASIAAAADDPQRVQRAAEAGDRPVVPPSAPPSGPAPVPPAMPAASSGAAPAPGPPATTDRGSAETPGAGDTSGTA
jgi:hypothetical protein